MPTSPPSTVTVMRGWIALQVARAGRSQTWQAAWRRTWVGVWPIDYVPFMLALYSLGCAIGGAVWLATGELDVLEFAGLEALGVTLGLVWLLWEPPWMRGLGPYLPEPLRTAQFFGPRPVTRMAFLVALLPALAAICGWFVARSWRHAVHPGVLLAGGIAAGTALAALSVHVSLVRRWRGLGRWEIRCVRSTWVAYVAVPLSFIRGPSTAVLGGAAAVPVLLSGILTAVIIGVWQIRDPDAADADQAHRSEVTGGWRVSTRTGPEANSSSSSATKAGEHWPPHHQG